ncbi:tRNA t(6)A37-methylthiotransferase [hydrothermal vent metagenome]|uniref:tRNA (N(6)-L-threonylcarbamoyladenosine(37)-C(2))-methylthiotransferase n=1 Tax=hydrothermal vent metagenome TaxID=652676 RepID=A0A3B0S0R5_9ZZZZ
MRKELSIITQGCRLNTFESEVMAEHAGKGSKGQTIVINTCAVTNEAVRNARRSIRLARRDNPSARIIATGCAVQIDPDSFAKMDELDYVLGNAEKMQPASWTFDAQTSRVRVNDITSITENAGHLIDAFSTRARTYVEVQNGCDHRCTFCIIPYGRGNARSVPAGEVVRQISRLSEQGVAEVVLTGVDLTSWGDDLPGRPRLGRLVKQILAGAPALPRLRLSSIDAIEIDEELFGLLSAEPRIAPHLHLSLQAGDNMILKRMKRRHSREDAIALCQRLREIRPDIAFGADLIAGFPTETEAMFENTLDLVSACDLAYLHVFPFSPRTGTPAARMPQVQPQIIRERAARLRQLGAQQLSQHLARHVGQRAEVLIEKNASGRLADFSKIVVENATNSRPGALLQVDITGHDNLALTGVIV